MNLYQIKETVKSYETENILPDSPQFTAVLIPLVEIDGKIIQTGSEILTDDVIPTVSEIARGVEKKE